jgi:hypothetical protein
MAQPSTDILMHPEYAAAFARSAYVWGWPLVNMLNRRATITVMYTHSHLRNAPSQ